MKNMKLKDKVVIVTGGNSGIGKAISLAFADKDANVAILDINCDTGVTEEISSKEKVLFFKADITIENEVNKAVKAIHSQFGKIDILVNNAGGILFDNKSPRTLIEDISLAEWEAIIKLNLTGTFICTKTVIPYMKAQKSGKIVNFSALAGKVGQKKISHYSAAKAGVIAFTQAAAQELSEFNIIVNAIAPGRTLTPALSEHFDAEGERWIKETLIKRLGDPQEIANLVLFLASDASNYIVGETININGGTFLD